MIGAGIRSYYEREIERKPLNNIVFFGGFALLTFLAIFLFGIRPTALALAQNNKYKKELEEIHGRMEVKLSQIDAAEDSLNRTGPGVESLNTAIPDGVLLQEFLQELVVESASSGFVVQRVKQLDVEGNEIPVDLEMSGQIGELASLLNNMENMRRFVNILDVRLDMDGSTANLKMRVKIYKI